MINKKIEKMLLLTLVFIIIIAILEIFFRFFYIETDSKCITLSARKWKEKYCRYNNEDFRDNKNFYIGKPEGVFRIGILGDSFVLGNGIKKTENRFSDILEKSIRDTYGITCEVYNVAKCGWNILDEQNYFLKKAVAYKFDALVISILEIDDLISTIAIPEFSDEYLDISRRNSFFLSPLRFCIRNSYAFSFFYAQYLKIQERFQSKKSLHIIEKCLTDENRWEIFEASIKTIKTQCDRQGTSFYIVSFPIVAFDKFKEFRVLEEKYEEKLKVYLDDNNIKGRIFLKEYFDKYNSKDLIVSSFDIHPNELAHNIVAEQLLKLLQEQIERRTKGSKE